MVSDNFDETSIATFKARYSLIGGCFVVAAFGTVVGGVRLLNAVVVVIGIVLIVNDNDLVVDFS